MSEEETNKPEQYVIMTQEVLCRKDISIMAKLVYARISGFKEFWESPETTGDFFGKSAKTIRNAKQELEKVGLIKCIKDTGRGKCYVAILRVPEIGQADCPKLGNQNTQNWATYNKEDNKEDNNITNKLVICDKSQNEVAVKETFGNVKINEAFTKWENVIGYPLKNTPSNRRAVYNMLRSKDKGEVWLDNMLALLAKAKEDRYSGIKISNYFELQRDWEKLLGWGSSKYKQMKNEQTVDMDDLPF